MIKLSDYVFKFLSEMGIKHVFLISGGMNMHLTDSVGKNNALEYICPLHEQAGAMAAEGYARIGNKMAVTLVTCGPSATNAITGLAGAWIDSIPSIYISGQVNLQDTIGNKPLRQLGLQEVDIVSVVKPLTKYAVMIDDPVTIKYHLQKAVYLAKEGRPGPVWIDIPLNLQGAQIDENKLIAFDPPLRDKDAELRLLKKQVQECIQLIKQSKRPVILVGYGVRLAEAQKEFLNFIKTLNAPVLTTWGAADLIHEEHDLFIGRPGLIGQRAANFTLQNSDVLLIIGSRLSIPQTGYNVKAFARASKVIMVDIDLAELQKERIRVDLPINHDAKEFLEEMNDQWMDDRVLQNNDWLQTCQNWKSRYPVVLKEYYDDKTSVNSYVFIDVLSDELSNDDVIVTDMGTSFTCTFQTFKVKQGQRLFTSSGLASMGYGLPGSIGACIANGKKRTICISGDGGLQMNLQELQTVLFHHLPIKLFVLNNKGYLAVKHHQDSNFQGRYVGADEASGVSLPDTVRIAQAYGLPTEKITNLNDLREKIKSVLKKPGPVVCEVVMPSNQILIPRLASKLKKDGTMGQTPLEDMYPFLEREEFLQNMIIPAEGSEEALGERQSTH